MAIIDTDLLDNIISKANGFIDSSSNNLANLLDTLSNLQYCYSNIDNNGFVSKNLLDGLSKGKDIKKMMNSYISVLESVKKGYVLQDQILADEIPIVFSNK